MAKQGWFGDKKGHRKAALKGRSLEFKKNLVRVTPSKKDAMKEKDYINKSLKDRGIKRRAYIGHVAQAYVKTLTRPGYKIAKNNYGIYMKDV